jgi:hypothetical protein
MGSDVLNFVVRMVIFAATFYFLAEFALVSKVPTATAMSVLVSIVVGILAYTIFHRAKFVVECEKCTHRHIA